MPDTGESMIDELQTELELVRLTKGPGMELTVVVRHALEAEKPAEIIGRDVRDIMSAPTVWVPAKTFEIRFPEYFAYMVRDEMASAHDEGVVLDGKQFCRYKESQFLDFIEKAAYGEDLRPHPLYHYGIFSIRGDIIDVITPKAPDIGYLGLSS